MNNQVCLRSAAFTASENPIPVINDISLWHYFLTGNMKQYLEGLVGWTLIWKKKTNTEKPLDQQRSRGHTLVAVPAMICRFVAHSGG